MKLKTNDSSLSNLQRFTTSQENNNRTQRDNNFTINCKNTTTAAATPLHVTPTVRLINGRNQNVSFAVAGLLIGGLVLAALISVLLKLKNLIYEHFHSR